MFQFANSYSSIILTINLESNINFQNVCSEFYPDV